MRKKRFSFFIFLILFAVAFGIRIFAQTANTETLGEGTFYAEAIFINGYDNHGPMRRLELTDEFTNFTGR